MYNVDDDQVEKGQVCGRASKGCKKESQEAWEREKTFTNGKTDTNASPAVSL